MFPTAAISSIVAVGSWRSRETSTPCSTAAVRDGSQWFGYFGSNGALDNVETGATVIDQMRRLDNVSVEGPDRSDPQTYIIV